jgi:replicative DNA helicase
VAADDFMDKVPPQNLEAERALLGCMLFDNHCISEVVHTVKNEDMYNSANRLIFETIVELYDANKAVDLIILREELKNKQILESIGGEEYLGEVADSVPSSANFDRYAEIVKDKALLRGLIQAASEILHTSWNSGEPAEDVLDRSERLIFDVADRSSSLELAQFSHIIKQAFERIDKTHDKKDVLRGIPTGFYELDELTSGLQEAEFVVLAARPSIGKTTMGLNIIEHAAVIEKKPVALFSMEMASQQIAQNMLCSYAKIDAHKLRKGLLSSEEWTRLGMAAGVLSEAPIYVDDSTALTSLRLRSRARRLKALYGVELIVIDYLQLMEGPRAENRQQQIATISRGLKALARELHLPVIAISQLNRAPEAREGHRPRLSDLRESGSIEQDADVVLLLHRDDYYHPDDPSMKGVAEIIVAKQRNGPIGRVRLHFSGNTLRFSSLSTKKEGPMADVEPVPEDIFFE